MSRPPVWVQRPDLSSAWRHTAELVGRSAERKSFHTVTVVDDPTLEDASIRANVDQLLVNHKFQTVETVANTIFPLALAKSSATPADLVSRYRAMYPRLKHLDRDNASGTYFGRLIEFPNGESSIDQLSKIIHRLRTQSAQKAPMGAAYEVTYHAADDGLGSLGVYHPSHDNKYRGFPCMSGMSFQRDRTQLHLLAHYRYEYLASKGYGNYLGLARLQSYIAKQSELEVGQLTIVAGRAYLDMTIGRLGQFLDGLPIEIN